MNIKIFKKGEDTQLTKSFNTLEFECRCTHDDCMETKIDMDHVNKLQEHRDKLKKSIHINSGYRCKKHNEDIGGSPKSQHMLGTATDIVVFDMFPSEVAKAFDDFDGVGLYPTFVHVDSRGFKARWGEK
jgi:uncharacterized protein YcbK (DUF882 family)